MTDRQTEGCKKKNKMSPDPSRGGDINYSKTCLKQPLKKKDQKLVFKTDYCLMQVKSIAECSREHSAILYTFIKLLFVFETFVLSILVAI